MFRVHLIRLFKLLTDIFGDDRVARTPTGDSMSVTVDGHVAFVSTSDLVSGASGSDACCVVGRQA